MNTCALLCEQLRIMELFGGCTINVQEIFVPAVVYHALEKVMRVTVPGRDEIISGKVRPPLGCVWSPQPFPDGKRTVKHHRGKNYCKELRGIS